MEDHKTGVTRFELPGPLSPKWKSRPSAVWEVSQQSVASTMDVLHTPVQAPESCLLGLSALDLSSGHGATQIHLSMAIPSVDKKGVMDFGWCTEPPRIDDALVAFHDA